MECPVCYERPLSLKLSCGHSFCKECVKSWYSAKNDCTCPMCRAPLDFKGFKFVQMLWTLKEISLLNCHKLWEHENFQLYVLNFLQKYNRNQESIKIIDKNSCNYYEIGLQITFILYPYFYFAFNSYIYTYIINKCTEKPPKHIDCKIQLKERLSMN